MCVLGGLLPFLKYLKGFVISKSNSQNKNSLKECPCTRGAKARSWKRKVGLPPPYTEKANSQ